MRPFSIILGLAFLFLQCEKAEEWTQFTVKYNETVEIESFVGINLPVNLPTPPIETNSDAVFENNFTRQNLIENVQLTVAELRLKGPVNGSFKVLNDVELYISAEGISPQLVAWKHDIPDNVGSFLAIETTGIDLKDFLKKKEIYFQLKVVTDEVLTSKHIVDIHTEYLVDAQVFGL